MTYVWHPQNEHLWKWGASNDDGTFDHGPCVVRGCDRKGATGVSQTSVADLFVEPLVVPDPPYADLELHPADPEPPVADRPRWPRSTLVLLAGIGLGLLALWWIR